MAVSGFGWDGWDGDGWIERNWQSCKLQGLKAASCSDLHQPSVWDPSERVVRVPGF